MGRKIAITKNGYDILRIIEFESNKDRCSFKIIPMVDNKDLKITATRMYELPEEVSFDINKRIELTYHKKDKLNSSKVHIKMIDKDNNVVFKTLPLKEIISPSVRVKIPVPLLKIVVPDNVLVKKYKKSEDKKEFDIGSNNIIEIYLINDIRDIDSFYRDFPRVFTVLFDNSFEFFTTGISDNRNGNRVFDEIGYKDSKMVMFGAQVNEEMAIWVNNVYDKNISNKKLELNFIENKYFLPIVINRVMYQNNYRMLLYDYDLYNNVMFSNEAKVRYKKWFISMTEEFYRFHYDHMDGYERICRWYG